MIQMFDLVRKSSQRCSSAARNCSACEPRVRRAKEDWSYVILLEEIYTSLHYVNFSPPCPASPAPDVQRVSPPSQKRIPSTSTWLSRTVGASRPTAHRGSHRGAAAPAASRAA